MAKPMRDPVSDFEYPDEWVNACSMPELLEDVRKGLCVLTASGKVLRRGYSTGATAAAACKAAILSLSRPVSSVSVSLPCGLKIDVQVHAKGGVASAFKFPGDYKDDATAGLEFRAIVRSTGDRIALDAGEGIGRFTRNMPRYPRGSAAISESARAYIEGAIKEALDESRLSGAEVELMVPGGEEVAIRTLNARMGIHGGISILGTTGLVEPWDDHVGESTIERIEKLDKVVITTGRIGLKYSRLLFPDHEAVLVGTGIGQALEKARGDVVLCGLPALILKFIDPDVLSGTGFGTVDELAASPSWEQVSSAAIAAFKKRMPGIRVVIVDRNGRVIGDDSG